MPIHDEFACLTLLILISTFNHLRQEYSDDCSIAVLDSLEKMIGEFDTNPLLQNLEEGAVSLESFGRIMAIRLGAATQFIPFLAAVIKKASLDPRLTEVLVALQENLDEELGADDPDASHEVWRQKFRSGMRRVFTEKGIAFGEPDRVIVQDIEHTYGEVLLTLGSENVQVSVGAFTALEGILANEFGVIWRYIKEHVPELTIDESLYIAHHAGHEGKHFKDMLIPVLKVCTVHPEIVPHTIDGMTRVVRLRSAMLQEIDTRIKIETCAPHVSTCDL